jgi:copper chaperone
MLSPATLEYGASIHAYRCGLTFRPDSLFGGIHPYNCDDQAPRGCFFNPDRPEALAKRKFIIRGGKMTEKTVTIPNISCGHCVATIKRELGELPGVESVDGDQQTRKVTIRWQEPATWETIVETLKEIEYPPEE